MDDDNAQKKKRGCPLKYKTPAEMREAIADYFVDCEERKNVPTVAELALTLGFSDSSGLRNYKVRDGFSTLLERAMTKLEAMHEGALSTAKNPVGHIFWLKARRGWVDKVVFAGSDGEPIQVQIMDKYAPKTPNSGDNNDNASAQVWAERLSDGLLERNADEEACLQGLASAGGEGQGRPEFYD